MYKVLTLIGVLLTSTLFSQANDSLLGLYRSSQKIEKKIYYLSTIIDACSADEVEYYNEEFKKLIYKNKANFHNDTFFKFLSQYYNNRGFVEENKANIKSALTCYQKSLALAEKANFKPQIASSFQNLASIYDLQQDYKKAIYYNYKSLAIKKEIKHYKGIAFSINNIAYIHTILKNYDSTKVLYNKSAEIFRKLKDEENLNIVLNNIGYTFMQQNMLDSALIYFQQTFENRKKNNDNHGLIYSYLNLSEIYLLKKELQKAEAFAKKAFELATNYGTKVDLRNVTNLLHEIYFVKEKYKDAYITIKKYFSYRDELTNEENKSEVVRQQLKYENAKKIAAVEKQRAIENTRSKEKSRRQFLIIIFGITGTCIILVFLFILIKRFKTIQQKNTLISSQKQVIEEKQHEISQSIAYAERIQQSFLASTSLFSENFKNSFLFFKPRDIVSGDFYWANKINNTIFICVGDSTGHGIPGAFMSLLNISLLNEGLLSKALTKPNQLLDFVRKILILGLKEDANGQGGKDGMDAACLSIDFNTLLLEYAGANNPLWIVRNQEIIEIKADKMPVGRSPSQDKPFTNNTIQLIQGDLILMFTDGFPDQFGGPSGKKFKYKPFKELFLNGELNSSDNVELKLHQTFEKWKGELEQTDDVCVLGLWI